MAIIPYLGKTESEKTTNQAYIDGSSVQIRAGEADLFKVVDLHIEEDCEVRGKVVTGTITSPTILEAIEKGRCFIGVMRRNGRPSRRAGRQMNIEHTQKRGRRQWYIYFPMRQQIQLGETEFSFGKPPALSNITGKIWEDNPEVWMKTRLVIYFAQYGGENSHFVQYPEAQPPLHKFLIIRNSENTYYYRED